jgi:thiosulfate/3-mercaptopyruvate sulfurtransferase
MNYQTIISPENLLEVKAIIIDCRFTLADIEYGRNEYNKGHIPGALYAHLDDDLSGEIIPGVTGRHPLPEKEDLISMFSDWGIDSNTQVVCYDDFHGGIAARLWWMLRWAGHYKVAVLDGGWKAWKEAGYEESKTVENSAASTFIPNFQDQQLIPMSKLRNAQKDGFTLVDARASFRYSGEREPIDPIAGHIPGALSFPFLDNLEESRWKTISELKNRFKDLPNKTIMYCGSGVTACHNILAQNIAGVNESILYSGSWSEWITLAENEIQVDV